MNRQRVLIVTLLVVLLVSSLAVFTDKSYPPLPATTTATIGNQQTLTESLPAPVTSYVLSRIKKFAAQHKVSVDRLSIKEGSFQRTETGYRFDLISSRPIRMDEGNEVSELSVEVRVNNYGNFFSIRVYINDRLQSIS